MTLKGKLRFASASLLVLVAMLALVGSLAIQSVTDSTDRMLEGFVKLDRVQGLRITLGRILVAPNDYLIFATPQDARRFDADLGSLKRHLRAVDQVVQDPRIHAAQMTAELIEAHGRAVFRLANPVGNALGQGLMKRLDEMVEGATDELDGLLGDTRLSATRAAESANQLERDARLVFVSLGAAAFAIAFVGVFLFGRRLATRLSALHKAVARLSTGDMETRVEIDTRDEIGQIGQAFNEMVEHLEEARHKLVDAERMAAVGQMAVTVKHEMNNPIHGIMIATQLVKETPKDQVPESIAEALDMIAEGCERLRDVVEKVTNVSDASVTNYVRDEQMIDIHKRDERA